MVSTRLKPCHMSRHAEAELTRIDRHKLPVLPSPYDEVERSLQWKAVTDEQRARLVCNLDGVVALNIPRPRSEEDEARCLDLFISGLKKLLTRENNWAFLQPLLLSLEYCVQCQVCSNACPIYAGSGGNDLYRPSYRAEILRRLVSKFARPGGKIVARLAGRNIDLNWTSLSRLYELSYRCTLCRRCAQACPMGVDNALITRELRKLFSQELGWAPNELHEKGTVLHLSVGSPSGMSPSVAEDNLAFIDEDFSETTGMDASTPWDVEGADVLLLQGAGEILGWPESHAALAILCNASGIGWTVSSGDPGYDGVNYGLFYDDLQFTRIALGQARTGKRLKAGKIVIGECGHEHKALLATADRLLTGDLAVPRESIMTFLEGIVFSGAIDFDPSRNDFPVTLHDPCNIVRNLGISEPQRRILNFLCPQFREMEPHGIDNYCCGGGGGLGLISENNFVDWRASVAGRLKFRQILEAFRDVPGKEVKKYVCAPCLNCKTQLRDIFGYYGARERSGIYCGGLVELIVNAMVDVKEPYIQWESA